jgi:hypothetical protein
MVQVLTIVVVVHVFPKTISPCIAQILSPYVWHIIFPFVVFIPPLCIPHVFFKSTVHS